jgi:hypothetical protein
LILSRARSVASITPPDGTESIITSTYINICRFAMHAI